VEGLIRPLIVLDPATPLDRALSRLRQSGQRAALVGSPAKPVGWVTLKDLVEEVTGELSRW
jgi:CBS domain containing-hemolysin-like protein